MSDEKQWNIVFALGVALNILVLFLGIVRTDLRTLYFNADFLYIPTLVADVAGWHGHFSDWHLTPAPYYFPDMFLYGAVWLSGVRNVEASQYLTGLLQLLLVILAARMLLRRLDPENAAASALVAPVMAAWVFFYDYGGMPIVMPGLVVSSHGGALLSTVTVFALCVRPLKPSHWLGGAAVVVISVLTALSDPLFVVASSGALTFTVLIELLGPLRTLLGQPRARNAAPSRLLLFRCALAAASGIAGYALARHFDLGSKANTLGSFAQALETPGRVWASSDDYPKYMLAGLAAVAVLAALVLINRWPARAGLCILARWQLLVTGAVLSAMAYTGAYVDRFSLRYASLACYFAVIFLTGVLVRVVARPEPFSWARRTLVAVSCMLAIGFAVNLGSIAHASMSAPQRRAAQCVLDAAKSAGVDSVVANYWAAKPLMLLSSGRVQVLQVQDNLEPYLWITSRGWYRDPKQLGIVVVNGLDRQHWLKALSVPQNIVWCDGLELWVYNDDARARMNATLHASFMRTVAQYDAVRDQRSQ